MSLDWRNKLNLTVEMRIVVPIYKIVDQGIRQEFKSLKPSDKSHKREPPTIIIGKTIKSHF